MSADAYADLTRTVISLLPSGNPALECVTRRKLDLPRPRAFSTLHPGNLTESRQPEG